MTTTRADLVIALSALAKHLDTRVEVWRRIITPDGREIGRRIYRGSFTRSPTSEHLTRRTEQ